MSIHAQGAGARSEPARLLIMVGGAISELVLSECAVALRRKFGFQWDVIAEAIADLRIVTEPVRPIDIDTHEAAVALARPYGSGFHDSLIVASAFEAECDTLHVTEQDLSARGRGPVGSDR